MGEQSTLINNAYQTFLTEAPEHAQAWAMAFQGLAGSRAVARKTAELAHLAVLAALRLESGRSFHVRSAKRAGAWQGHQCHNGGTFCRRTSFTQVLPLALEAYDAG